MAKIRTVKTDEVATASIQKFRSEVEGNLALQRVLGYARAWYAVKDAQGVWTFAPSKFAGYESMTGDIYVKNYKNMNGRETERVLGEWYTFVDSGHPLYSNLNTKLKEFLEQYDKSPSSASRIGIANHLYEIELIGEDYLRQRQIADLIVVVGRGLSAKERKRVVSSLSY